MSEVKQLDPASVCRLIVALGPSKIDETEIRQVLGGVVLTSMSQVAQAFAISADTVRHTWRRDGMPGEAKRGTSKGNKFPLDEILIWWLKREGRATVARGKDEYTDRIRAAEARKIEAAAEMAERQLQQAAGQHVEVNLVRSEWTTWLTAFRDAVLEIPRHIKPMLPSKVAERVSAEVDRRLRHELTALSERQFSKSMNGVNHNGQEPDDGDVEEV